MEGVISSLQSNAADTAATDLLQQLRRKGVVLWAEDGALRYRAPKGVVTVDDMTTLRAHRERVMTLLTHCGASARRHSSADSAPLTPQQLAHWRLHKLDERPGVRQIAASVRLHGSLQVCLMRKCFSLLVERHQALRTRLTLEHGVPVQIVDARGRCELAVGDFGSETSVAAEQSAKQILGEMIVQPVRVGIDPLLIARLIRIRDCDHILLIALEHSISDAVSLDLLIRDLLRAYRQMASGVPVVLPAIRRQFIEHAREQWRALESMSADTKELWRGRLRGYGRLCVPADMVAPEYRLGWGSVPVRIDAVAKARLQEWSRMQRTTLVMSVFTAFVAVVLRWCAQESGVVRYQTDGRFSPDIQNTIGYFAIVLPLRVTLRPGDRFSDLLRRVTEEFVSAHEHYVSCDVDAQLPRPPYMYNSGFNWVPEGMSNAAVDDELIAESRPFSSPMLAKVDADGEPSLLLYDTADGIVGEVLFPRRRFSEDSMKRFVLDLAAHVDAMQAPSNPVVEHVRLVGSPR